MTGKRLALIAAAVVVLAIPLGLALGFFNPLGGDNAAHPPCEELPSRAEVAQAIDERTSLVDRLTAAGDVEVLVGEPCPDPDRALVTVRTTTAAEEEAVRAILSDADGFGVPAVVERG